LTITDPAPQAILPGPPPPSSTTPLRLERPAIRVFSPRPKGTRRLPGPILCSPDQIVPSLSRLPETRMFFQFSEPSWGRAPTPNSILIVLPVPLLRLPFFPLPYFDNLNFYPSRLGPSSFPELISFLSKQLNLLRGHAFSLH